MIRTSVSGTGSPIDPALRTPLNGFACVTGRALGQAVALDQLPAPVTRSNFLRHRQGQGRRARDARL